MSRTYDVDTTALLEEMRSLSDALVKNEPDEVSTIRRGDHHRQAGAGGQYFTSWDTAHGMLRDWACYGLFPLLKLTESNATNLTPRQLLEIWAATSHKYSAYLGYSGFGQLHEFQERAYAACLAAPDTELIASLLRELVRYSNRLTAWSHHYFPWGVGAEMRYPDASANSAIAEPTGPKDVLQGIDGPRIRITWEPLGVTAEAVLAESLNPELVRDFMRGLPFTILQEHALVSGESMFAWTPLVSTAHVRHNERICEAPIGRLRYSQATGQKFIVQYGTTTEDLASPLLGQIIAEDCSTLATIGAAAWRNTVNRSEEIWVSVELA